MTIEIETYNTLDEAKQAKLRSGTRHQTKWKSLHTDFINNKYRITWVNGTDDPENDPIEVAKRQQQKLDQIRQDELKEKLKNRTISQPELFELLEILL